MRKCKACGKKLEGKEKSYCKTCLRFHRKQYSKEFLKDVRKEYKRWVK